MPKLSKQSSGPRCFSKANQTSWLYSLFLLWEIEEHQAFLLPQLVQVWDSCWDASQLPSEESWEICSNLFRMSRGFQIVSLGLSISYPRFEPENIDLSLFKIFFLQIFFVSGSVFGAYQLDLANVIQYGWDGREQKVRKTKSHSWKLKSVKLLIAVRISSLMEQVTEKCPPVSESRTKILPG